VEGDPNNHSERSRLAPAARSTLWPVQIAWQVAGELQRQYPLIDVRPNCLYVDDGDILTSAGVTTGIDLCLHLIRRDKGAAAANRRTGGPCSG
jgi:hypothetical protein